MPRVCKILKKTEENLLKENLECHEWVSIKSQELPVHRKGPKFKVHNYLSTFWKKQQKIVKEDM